MSKLPQTPSNQVESGDELPTQGANLTAIYSLIAVALIVAIGFAVLIVLPFYHRR
jgi:hypothetical protein